MAGKKQGFVRTLSVLIALVLVVGAVWYFMFGGKEMLAGGSQYTYNSQGNQLPATNSGNNSSGSMGGNGAGVPTTVARGSLSVDVHASGNVKSGDVRNVYVKAPGRISQINVQNGDHVNPGDVLMTLDSDELDQTIRELSATLLTEQVNLQDSRDTGGSTTLKSPANGRVKLIHAEVDDDVPTVMERYGALCYVSRDGKMRVEFDANESVGVGDAVRVQIGNSTEDGLVTQTEGLQGKTAVIIDSDKFDVGAECVVMSALGDKLGTGELQLNMPIPVMGTVGKISKISYEENATISSGSIIFTLTGKLATNDMQKQLLTYNKAKQDLADAKAKRDSLVVRAPISGTVADLSARVGQLIEEDANIMTLYSDQDFEVITSVDELDIAQVTIGQRASVSVDALPGRMFDAAVKRIGGVGTVESGVTTFDVALSVSGVDGLLVGMTASADITVFSKPDALLVPVSAIRTVSGQSYVTVSGGYDASGNPQTSMRSVRVGQAGDDSVEILEGLSEGEIILVTPQNTSSGQNFFGGNMNFMGGGAGGTMRMGAGTNRNR